MRRTAPLRFRVTASVLLTALLVLTTTATSTATAGTIRTVAFTGQPAPGVESGLTWSDNTIGGFGFVSVNNAGETAFGGSLVGPSVNNTGPSRGVWSEGGGAGLHLVARGQNVGGVEAPGTSGGAVFTRFSFPSINDAGQVLFRATLFGPGANCGGALCPNNQFGLWRGRGVSDLTLVARDGDPAPDTNDEIFSGLRTAGLLFNNAGQTALFASAGPALVPGLRGIWSEGRATGLTVVIRGGDAAPGTAGGVTFQPNGLTQHVFNGAGQIAFRGFLTGTGVNSGNSSGIWSEGGGGGLALVAREGEEAPGVGSGVSFGFFGASPALNDAGQIAFVAGIVESGQNLTSIWSDGGGAGLAEVARDGDAAPGTAGGVSFSLISNFAPVLNGAGQTAFLAVLTGPGVDSSNNSGIWSEGGGDGLALVARVGDPAPGLATGATFSSIRVPFMNRAGQTAFKATAGFPDAIDPVVAFPREGIWVEHPSGNLALVARVTDLFDVDDGPGTDFRTVSRLTLVPTTGNEDGRNRGFNDRGQLAFLADFTDRSNGVFVFDPDPSITITSPVDGATVGAGEILVEGVATDDGEIVSVVVNGVPADLVSTGDPSDPAEVSFSALVPLDSGENEIVAVATDGDDDTAEASLIIENEPETGPLVCDANGDGSVDRVDIAAIFGARGSVATGPDDPRDINRDGLITVNDGRLCVLECTNPRCAPSAP